MCPGDPWLFVMTCSLGMNVGMTIARAQRSKENNNDDDDNDDNNNNNNNNNNKITK